MKKEKCKCGNEMNFLADYFGSNFFWCNVCGTLLVAFLDGNFTYESPSNKKSNKKKK